MKKIITYNNKALSITGGKVMAMDYDLDTYLNFYMPNGGTISLTKNGSPTAVTLEYSTDNCKTWQIWEEVGTSRSLVLPAGGRMWIRNTSSTSTGFSTSLSNYYNFAMTDTTEAHGNCNSLLCKNPDDAVLTNYCFNSLFMSSPISTAPDLMSETLESRSYYNMFRASDITVPPIMKAKTLSAASCYAMFFNCESLTESPLLLAKTLYSSSYGEMFYMCYNLKKVTLYAQTIESSSLVSWLSNTYATGDFYCPQNLTIPTGTSGIPRGWTRHDLSELE